MKKFQYDTLFRLLLPKILRKKSFPYLIILVLVLVSIQMYAYFSNKTVKEGFIVSRIIDGDTIEVTHGSEKLTIRYIGINTPETVKPNSPIECFGKQASAYNKEILQGQEVTLESDIQDKDRYGRLLRYIYFKDKGNGSVMVNKKLVEEGYAYASSYPPNVKYQDEFKEAERKARGNKKGLWGECPA